MLFPSLHVELSLYMEILLVGKAIIGVPYSSLDESSYHCMYGCTLASEQEEDKERGE